MLPVHCLHLVTPALIALGAVLWGASGAAGQGLPAACTRVLDGFSEANQHLASASEGAIASDVRGVLSQLSGDLVLHGRDDIGPLRELWARDSAGVEAALAWMIVGRTDQGARDAAAAAAAYRILSGRSTPVLSVMALVHHEGHRGLALRAIARLDAPDHSRLILGYACASAFRLLAATAAPDFARKWRWESLDTWPEEVDAVLDEASRLLEPRHQRTMAALRALQERVRLDAP